VEQQGSIGHRCRLAWYARQTRSRGPAALALLGGLCALAGCTTVTIEAGDGSVTVERGFGLVSVQPVPGRTPMVIRSTSLGWQSGPAGQVLGFASARLTLLPPGCHLVLLDGAGSAWPQALWQRLAGSGLCQDDEPPPGER
jgi:hypothetical protein